MSNESNSILYGRAYEVAEEAVNHPSGLDKALFAAIEDGDLDNIKYLTNKLEGLLAIENFHNNDILEATDVY